MKHTIAMFIFTFILISASFAQTQTKPWTLDDIIEMKSWGVSEDEILQQIQQKGIVCTLDKDVFLKLKAYGFSLAFIQKLREYLERSQQSKGKNPLEKDGTKKEALPDKPTPAPSPDKPTPVPTQPANKPIVPQEQKSPPDSKVQTPVPISEKPTPTKPKEVRYYKITTRSNPPEGGKVVVTPSPDKEGRLAEGTEIQIRPDAVDPYLFDHWEGDARGYHSLIVRISKDITLVACFQKPEPPEKPHKIENPKEFKDTRKEGYLYKGEAIGIVEGRGTNKD